MTAPLVQRLSLVVDAATGATETRMDAVATASREAGNAAERSAGQVAAAAERVAAAQLRRDTAADRVTLAERRLQEVQGRYAAGSSQVLAAEQRLEQSRRELHVATRQVETAQEQQTRAVRDSAEASARASTETERAGRGAQQFSGQLDNLKAAAAGLVGFQVGDWLRDQAQAYLNGARGAQTLATSMNATIEQGGQLSQLFSTLGLDAADLLEIQAEFAQKIGENGRNLQEFGASLEMNSNGTVNWAGTLVDALTHLQKIPDATERNRRGFQLFGEEGYKQLSRLLSSGMSVEEALDAIGTPFTEEDVQATQAFDREMMRLQLSAGDLGRTLAREVVPVASELVGGVSDLVGVVATVPLPITLATAAAVIMARAGITPAAMASARLTAAMTIARAEIAVAGGAMLTTGVAAGVMGAGLSVASASASRLMGFVGGPLGAALIAAGAAFHFASQGSEELEENARRAAVELEGVEGNATRMKMALTSSANDLEENAGYWERSAAYVKGYQEGLSGVELAAAKLISPFQRLTMGVGDTADTAQGFELAIQEARDELGAFGAQEALTQVATRSLNDLIAQGTTSGDQFTDAVRRAADAERDQSRTSDMAAAALAAYRAQTDQAVESTRGLIDARYALEDAQAGFLSALDAAKDATDDQSTSMNEARQAQIQLMQAALRAGDVAADAAVAQARAAGTIVTPLDEARIRADALITDLQSRLNTPGLTESARMEMQGLIDQLTEARDKGDVNALVTLTGADEASGELDETTRDRESRVNVESRGGPAVDQYLDRLAEDRPSIVRVESRGGPAVVSYLDRVSTERLSIVRVESRNGPAVDSYIGGLTRERLSIIRVETRGGPAVDQYLDELAGRRRTAVIDVQRRTTGAGGGAVGTAGLMGAGPVSIGQLIVQPQVDSGGRLSAGAQQVTGRQVVTAIREYERQNGPGWRGGT